MLYRSTPIPATAVPIPIDLQESETAAIIVLFDEHLVADPAWVDYVNFIVKESESDGLRKRVFPVSMFDGGYKVGAPAVNLNFVRWDAWFGDGLDERIRKLQFQLTYQFCRMLRLYLAHIEHPDVDGLKIYLERVRIFVSHSKHDDFGEDIAKSIRVAVASENDLDSFFDVINIPPGLMFSDVITHNVSISAVVAVHTDSFSSREWCRREILTAKRYNVPLVVANCIVDCEERGFPYLGNVPVIRMEPGAKHRISIVLARLLDEVLKAFFWAARIHHAVKVAAKRVEFLPRPPELISLVSLLDAAKDIQIVVYPDPPLGIEELALFESLAANLTLHSYTEWLALPKA